MLLHRISIHPSTFCLCRVLIERSNGQHHIIATDIQTIGVIQRVTVPQVDLHLYLISMAIDTTYGPVRDLVYIAFLVLAKDSREARGVIRTLRFTNHQSRDGSQRQCQQCDVSTHIHEPPDPSRVDPASRRRE